MPQQAPASAPGHVTLPRPRNETPAIPRPRPSRGPGPTLPLADDPLVENLRAQQSAGTQGYYLPGHLSGERVQCLIDSGCTVSVVSCDTFRSLPRRIRETLEGKEGVAHVADGSETRTLGYVTLKGRLRHWRFPSHRFLVADVVDDVLLGLDFLESHDALLDFANCELQVGADRLRCQDRDGNHMQSSVTAIRRVVVPPRSEMIVPGKLRQALPKEWCVVEAVQAERPFLVGGTLSQNNKTPVSVRVLNPTDEELVIPSGRFLARAAPVSPDMVKDAPEPSGSRANLTESDLPNHVRGLFDQAKTTCVTAEDRTQLIGLLTRYQSVFSASPTDLGRTRDIVHSIPTRPDARPIKQKPRRLGPEKEAEVERQVRQLESDGLIEPASGAWSSPVVLVRKSDHSWRFCVDYRRLNDVTIKDAYPLPRIDDSLDALSGSQYFSTLDLVSGYWQVELDEEARDKSAFVTRNGLWKWRVLPFGLTSAPSTFERLMEKVLRGLHWRTLMIYLDDVVVFSSTISEHIDRLETVLQRLEGAGLKLKPSKCELFKRQVKYLGHIVSSQGISTDPSKVKDVADWPRPDCVRQVRAFVGLTGYYRRFIPSYAEVARPLHRLTNKGADWDWTEACTIAFETLKHLLCSAPILAYPDPKCGYLVDTDASDEAMGAVLSQIQDGRERPVAYFSKTFSAEERNYCVTRRELLAVVSACKHFRPYLYGREFPLRTDHESLTWMVSLKEPRGQVARWLEDLQEFNFCIQHRRGTSHGNADGLSRRPCPSSCKSCVKQEAFRGPSSNTVRDSSCQTDASSTGGVTLIGRPWTPIPEPVIRGLGRVGPALDPHAAPFVPQGGRLQRDRVSGTPQTSGEPTGHRSVSVTAAQQTGPNTASNGGGTREPATIDSALTGGSCSRRSCTHTGTCANAGQGVSTLPALSKNSRNQGKGVEGSSAMQSSLSSTGPNSPRVASASTSVPVGTKSKAKVRRKPQRGSGQPTPAGPARATDPAQAELAACSPGQPTPAGAVSDAAQAASRRSGDQTTRVASASTSVPAGTKSKAKVRRQSQRGSGQPTPAGPAQATDPAQAQLSAGSPGQPTPLGRASDAQADSRRSGEPVQVRLLHRTSDVQTRQQSEAPLDEVYLAVKRQEKPRTNELAQCSWEGRKWFRLYDQLSIREDGVLQVRMQRNGRWITTVCCPPSLRESVVSETHQAAHLGEWKTTRRVQLNWHWPGLFSHVRQYVRSCPACQIGKKSGTRQPGSRHRLYAGRPWQRVAADLAGPLDKTSRGNQWILVVTDHFTRWSDAFPLPDAKAETVAQTLESRIFSSFGVPEVLHTDQGAQFEGELMHELCALWGVDKTRTAPYRPQANGQCERINRVMADSLRALLEANAMNADDWDLLVPQIMKVIRASPHSSTGETANFLMFGRELRLPSSLLTQLQGEEQASTNEYVENLRDRMARAHDALREKQLEIRTDDSHEPSLFKEGDYVYMRCKQRKKGRAAKLHMQYVGPYLVTQALPFHTYRLSRDGATTLQHESRLKLHASRERGFDPTLPRDGPRALPPPARRRETSVVPRYPFPDDRETTYYVEQPVPRQRFRMRRQSDSEPENPSTLEIISLPDGDPHRVAQDFPSALADRAAPLAIEAPEQGPPAMGAWASGNPITGRPAQPRVESDDPVSITDFPSLGEATRTRSGRAVVRPDRYGTNVA